MGRFSRPCIKCGALTKTAPRGLCPTCHRGYAQAKETEPKRLAKKQFLYGGDYRKKAQAVRMNAKQCYLCGGGFTPDDPPEADHIYPELGQASPLAAIHRKCNQKKGNQPWQPQ